MFFIMPYAQMVLNYSHSSPSFSSEGSGKKKDTSSGFSRKFNFFLFPSAHAAPHCAKTEFS